MKTIKELEETKDNTFERGYEIALKDVLKLIDECSEGKGEWYKYYIKVKELKQKIKGE